VVALFAIGLAVYLFTANGHVQTADYAQEVWVSAAMAAGRGFAVDGLQPGGPGAPQVGRDGRAYAAHDLGSSLLLYPLAALLPDAHRNGLPTDRLLFLSAFLAPVVAALTVALFADLLLELGVTTRSVIVTSLLYAFGTLIWPFAHISFDVTPTALFVLLAVCFLARLHRKAIQLRWTSAAGVAMAWAVLIRIDAVVIALAMTVAILDRAWRERRQVARATTMVLAWALPVAGAVGVYLWYNWQRFGSVFDSGHNADPNAHLTGSVPLGVVGQLFSPGRGLLFFSPLVIVAAFGWRKLLHRNRLVAIASSTAIVGCILAHAALENWSGEDTWGPRYLVPVAALAVLPLGFVVDRIRTPPRPLALALATGTCSLLAVAVQVVGASTHYFFAKVGDVVRAGGLSLHQLYWSLDHAQILVQAKALGRGLAGHAPYVTVSQGGRAPERIAPVDWWWANDLMNDRHVAGTVLTLSLCLLVGMGASVVLGWAWHHEESGSGQYSNGSL
jgi:hypothetical protein